MRASGAYAVTLGRDGPPLGRRLRDRLGVFAFVAVDDAYSGDYRGAVVLDLGAHKGYYGAYALGKRGAATVISYEPGAANYTPRRRRRPRTLAIGGSRGGRRSALRAGAPALHLMGASWGHSLIPPTGSRRTKSASAPWTSSPCASCSSRLPASRADGAWWSS